LKKGGWEGFKIDVVEGIYTLLQLFDSYDGDCSATHCSLRDAISQANNCTGHNEIRLPAGEYFIERLEPYPYPEDSDITRGDFDISDDLTITGNPFFAASVNAMFRDRLFDVWRGTTKIQNLQMVNGRQRSEQRPGSAIYIRKSANGILTNIGLYDNGSLTSSIPTYLDNAIAVQSLLWVELLAYSKILLHRFIDPIFTTLK
jgi:CSLREA domain-containing protein